MKYLVVLAHPDDETDIGGTLYKLKESGHEVAVALVVGKVEARRNISDTLSNDEEKSMDILGVEKIYHADFPNIKTNIISHLDIVKFIEKCIYDWQPEAIITHHAADVNIDHVITCNAAIAACRLFQRNDCVVRLKLLLCCESAGATEWSLNSSKNRFMPNYFVEIGEEGLIMKLKAHDCYIGVDHEFPHPYSHEVYKGLAKYRGAQAGCYYAEAFECVFRSE